MTLTPSFVVAAGGTFARKRGFRTACIWPRQSSCASPSARRRIGGARSRSCSWALRRLCSGAFCSRCVPSSGRCFWCAACRRSALLLSGRRPRPPFRRRRRPGAGPLARPVSPDDLRLASSGASCGVRAREGRGVRRVLLDACWMLCCCLDLRWRHEAPSPSTRAASGKIPLCGRLAFFIGSCWYGGDRDVCRCHGVRAAVQFWRHLHLGCRNDRKRGMVLHAYWARGPCGQSRCRYPLRSPRCARAVRRPWAAHGDGRCALSPWRHRLCQPLSFRAFASAMAMRAPWCAPRL